MKYIQSLSNIELKHIVKLQNPKARKQFNQYCAEGIRTVETLLKGTTVLEKLYVTEQNIDIATKLAPHGLITVVSEDVMKKMSNNPTPSGLLALCKIPHVTEHTLNPGLVITQMSDPGNMGTLIRTAAACNISNVVIVEGTDPWSPKVVQASAGTLSWVTILQWDWKTLHAQKGTLQLCALVVDEGQSPTTIDKLSALLVVGNEAHGIPLDWQKQCDKKVHIPMPGKTESLNAAIAGSLAMYMTFVLSK